MARCDEGYRCEICGQPVVTIDQSALYLRFVLGQVRLEELPFHKERHLRCDRELSQYIVDPAFPPVVDLGPRSDKRNLEPGDVHVRESHFTRAWRRLLRLPGSGLPLSEYPMPEEPDALEEQDDSREIEQDEPT